MEKKILVADDSLTIQKVVELTFADSGYRLTSVSNGRVALEKARLDPPDLILADVVMPEKNGYEVCEEIKKNPATSRIPVVLLAGTFEPFDRERAERLGCDAIVRKPFDSRELLRKVDSLLGGAAVRPGARAETAPVPTPTEPAPPTEPAEPVRAFAPPPPIPFSAGLEAGFAEEDFTGAIRTFSRMTRAEGSESLAGLYGPEDVESALAAFREVEATSKEETELRRSTDPVPSSRRGEGGVEGRISRDSLARYLGEAAAQSAPPPAPTPAPSDADDGRTRRIDVSAFRSPAPGDSSAPVRRDDFFVPDPAARREPPAPAPAAAPVDRATSPEPEAPPAPPPAPSAGARELTDAEIDRIAERLAQKVIERISDRVVREVAWEVVPDTAEAVVRERVRELESGVD